MKTSTDGDNPSPPGEAFREALAQIRELWNYAQHFFEAKLDTARLTFRNTLILFGVGALMMMASLSILVTAIVIFCIGLAQAMAALLGGHMWAGNLIVGAFLILAMLLGIWIGVRRLSDAWKLRTVEHYERKLRRQRIDLGHDVRERAAEHDVH
jgi:hypothetical protein